LNSLLSSALRISTNFTGINHQLLYVISQCPLILGTKKAKLLKLRNFFYQPVSFTRTLRRLYSNSRLRMNAFDLFSFVVALLP
jgi:hypothetical protein